MRIGMWWRHLPVMVAVLVVAGAAAAGWIGPAIGRERIVGYQVVAMVGDDGSVRIREVIDWEFGAFAVDKHGIFRDIPVGPAGLPVDVEVSSPGAPADVTQSREGTDLRLRIGDPNRTVRGRQRYVISYTLPTAVRDGHVALDLVGTRWHVPIAELDARIIGADLAAPTCFEGTEGDSSMPCTTEDVDAGIRAEVTSLGANRGVTVGADVGTAVPTDLPPVAAIVPRDDAARTRWALTTGIIGLAIGLATYLVCRRVGRNEVANGGATEAAFVPYGDETFGPAHAIDRPPPGVRLVADESMADLAGFDFVPPGGIEPWQGSAVLREAIDDRTTGAWFSSLAAHDILQFGANDWGGVRIQPGPAAATADPTVAPILNLALAGRPGIDLGGYDPAFSQAWSEAARAVEAWVVSSGTFRRRPPRARSMTGSSRAGLVLGLGGGLGIPAVIGLVILGYQVGPLQGAVALALAVLVPGLVGLAAYWTLVRSLSWQGSAIALRTEAFRRFLHDSEAQHVEWAWNNGLLREYSAWAVALGEAKAWNKALAGSAVPPFDQAASSSVMAPAIYASSFSSSHTEPSSSGGGGGGDGGGSSGGGDGGGGGGSW